jgi:GGDEF domain-containing protein
LQAVIWAAVRDELRSPEPDLVTQLTERLTLVAELLRGAALGRPVPSADGLRDPGARVPDPPPPVASSRRVARAAPPPAPAPSWPAPSTAPPASPPRSWPTDGRGEAETPAALWVEALEEEIRRSVGSSLSLLLAELEDGDRVAAIETPPEAGATFSQFAGAVRSAVRRHDILVCESDARAWIIARDTARPGAYALGERIAEAVSESRPWHGAPLTASVGVAVLGEDGRTAAELIEAAEQARFAAAASGVDMLRGAEPEPQA